MKAARNRQGAIARPMARTSAHNFADGEFSMTDTANHLVPERRKIRRALAAIFSSLQAMEHTSFDYTLDRIERLEREVRQLKDELRQIRDPGAVEARNTRAAALEH